VLRQTVRKRLQAKLNEVKAELRRRMHHPIPEVGQWLRSVVDGHNRYYGVPMNDAALHLFRLQVGRLWHRALSRRSQNGHVPWHRMHRLMAHWLHPVRIYRPYPLRRMGVVTQGKSRMREIRSSGSAEGVMGNCDPYSDSPSLRSSINHSLLGSRGRHCYAIMWLLGSFSDKCNVSGVTPG
jgi:hypothetical protein